MIVTKFTRTEKKKMTDQGPHNRTHEDLLDMIADDLSGVNMLKDEVERLRGEIRALTLALSAKETEIAQFHFHHYGAGNVAFFVKE